MRFFYGFIGIFLFMAQACAADSYADLIEEIVPSVVNISTERKIVNSHNENIDNFMLNQDMSGRESLGSGFFIRQDGFVLTNYHVIKEAKSISVITNDEKSYEAKLLAFDQPSDLAVLKIIPKDKTVLKFKPVVFGNTDKARIGDKVLTFGNPYGLGISVSQGIISAKSRHIGLGEQQYIQTDAAINQGNSGGPMFNLSGEVIGINSAVFSANGATGVGFALPSNMANWVASQLINNGKVRRGWIGFSIANGIDQYTGQSGYVITEIDEASNAYKEGLRVGDIIISYNDKPADDLTSFTVYTEIMEPGQILKLKVLSLGEMIKVNVRIQEMPSKSLADVFNKALVENNKYNYQSGDADIFYISELGIAVKDAEPRGLIIVKMENRSTLRDKGIKEGDIILEADRSDIYSADNLLENIHNAIVDDYRPLSLLIQSLNDTFYVQIEVPKEND